MKKLSILFFISFISFFSFCEDFKPFKIGSDSKTVINTMMLDNWNVRIENELTIFTKENVFYDGFFEIEQIVMAFDDKQLLAENITIKDIIYSKTINTYIINKVFDCHLTPLNRIVEKKENKLYDDFYNYSYKCYDNVENIYWIFDYSGVESLGYYLNISLEKIEN